MCVLLVALTGTTAIIDPGQGSLGREAQDNKALFSHHVVIEKGWSILIPLQPKQDGKGGIEQKQDDHNGPDKNGWVALHDTVKKVIENDGPTGQMGQPGENKGEPVLVPVTIGAGLGIDGFVNGSQQHGGGRQAKNGKEKVNVGNTGQLGNHDAHDTGRKGIFEPPKGILIAGNVVIVRGFKHEGGQVIAPTQGQKGTRIPRDTVAIAHLFTFGNAKVAIVAVVQTSRKVRKQEPLGVGLAKQ